MKERISIHFFVTYIYIVLTRNLLGSSYLYGKFNTDFQMSLIYSLLIAVALTIIIEMWKMFIETIHIKNYISTLIICLLIAVSLIIFLKSTYYAIMIAYIAFYIIKDCYRMI